MTILDLQRYPRNLIKNVENTVVFLTRKMFSPLHLINKKCASHFHREAANENKHFKETNFIRQSFHGSVVNHALPSLQGSF